MAEGEKKFSAVWQRGCTRFEDLNGLTEEIRASMQEQAAFMRQSVPVVPGKYPVVLSPEAAGVFAHESFGHKKVPIRAAASLMLRAPSGRRTGGCWFRTVPWRPWPQRRTPPPFSACRFPAMPMPPMTACPLWA